ncbi:TPA: hypothetical protein ACG6KY_002046, partial [Streptococcus agalactiae]
MFDYFKLYTIVLETFVETKPDDAYSLFDNLSLNSEFVKFSKDLDKNIVISGTLEVIDNLLDDCLIKGKRRPTKDITFYFFDGVTTTGYLYLQSLKDNNFSSRLKNILKEEGIPLTPTSIT